VPSTMLVVDDSATMRKVFELTFGGEDYTLVTHDGSDSLLARAREVQPNLAVIDVALGASSGYDACRAIKGAISGVHVLMLGSEQNPVDEGKAKEAGADGTLVKPFETQGMIDKVRAILGGAPAAAAPGAPKATTTSVLHAPPGAAVPGRPASAGFPAGASASQAPRTGSTQTFAAPPGSASAPPGAYGAAPTPKHAPEPEIEMDSDDEVATPPPSLRPAVAAVPQGAAARPPGGTTLQHAAPPPGAPPVARAPAPAAPSASVPKEVQQRIAAMGLTPAQADAVTALTRDVVERVVWEVVAPLAETMLREEIRRLTAD